MNGINFLRHGIKNIERILYFCNPYLPEGKIKVFYPPQHIDCSISTNVLKYFEHTDRRLYNSKEEFIEALKMFIPSEKMEEKNGMLNITYPKELIRMNTLLMSQGNIL